MIFLETSKVMEWRDGARRKEACDGLADGARDDEIQDESIHHPS